MHESIINIYAEVLKKGRALICEKDDSYYPPLYKISVCYPEILHMVYRGVILFKDAEFVKKKIIRTWTFQAGEEPFKSYEKSIFDYKVKEQLGAGCINPTAVLTIK